MHGDIVVIEDLTGTRHELKTIVELAIGDFVISQGGFITEKMDKEQVDEIFNIIKREAI